MIKFLPLLLLLSCNESFQREEPFFQEQWAIHFDKPFYKAYGIDKDAHIHGEQSLKNFTGKGVRVAIIDTELDVNHKEFEKSKITAINSRDLSSNVSCKNCATHGTAVTGIIASNINGFGLRGIAPEVEILFIKLDLNGYLSDSEIIDAFDIAAEYGADVINCSWGTNDLSPILKERIVEIAKEIPVVFSVANDGAEIGNDETSIDEVISVGSTDSDNLRAIYSSFGESLDILAPGGFQLGITTIDIGGNFLRAEDKNSFRGTSASAPIVTGLIALILEKNPNLRVEEIETLLKSGSDKIGTLEYKNGRNLYYGFGKVNFDKTLKLVQ
jgi:subtilisin family serine protease